MLAATKACPHLGLIGCRRRAQMHLEVAATVGCHGLRCPTACLACAPSEFRVNITRRGARPGKPGRTLRAFSNGRAAVLIKHCPLRFVRCVDQVMGVPDIADDCAERAGCAKREKVWGSATLVLKTLIAESARLVPVGGVRIDEGQRRDDCCGCNERVLNSTVNPASCQCAKAVC